MKLLSFLKEAHRTEANAWIEANIQGAGPNTYVSVYTKTGEDGVFYFGSYWLCDETTKDTVVNYLTAIFPEADWDAAYLDESNSAEPEATKQAWGYVPNDI